MKSFLHTLCYSNFSLIPKHSLLFLLLLHHVLFQTCNNLALSSSMEDKNPQPTKPHKLNSQVPTNHENSSKLVNNFIYKAIIFTVFLVILPLLPSILPEFIDLNFNSRIWELFQLICVGIAVSYGLFSKKNEGNVEKEAHICSVFDNANTYINRLLQVSSVFDNDEVENPSASSDGNKLQSWSSQYNREEPIVMVANESPSLEDSTAATSRIEEKPLLLPVRSLKSRVSEANAAAAESCLLDRFDSNTNSGSNRFSEISRKLVKEDTVRVMSPQNLGEKIVHPSLIPWRSRSERMEMKLSEDSPLMEDSETQFRRSSLSRSFKLNSTTSSSSPSTRSCRYSSVASESKEDIVDNSVRRKIHYPISSPPPAAPPPPALILHNKPSLLKSTSGLSQNNDFLEINSRSSSVESVKNDYNQTQSRKANSISELRPIGPRWKNLDEKGIAGEIEGPIMEKLMPCLKKESLIEYPKEDKKGFNENVLVESESEEDEKNTDNSKSAFDKEESQETVDENIINTDEGPDVDKKAEEFIAKFKEQIRLQRTQRSTGY